MARTRWVALVCSVGLACGVMAKCVAQDWSPPVSQRDLDIAAETGSQVGDFPDAVLNGEPGSQDSCSVTVRAMKAGSMTPIVSGFKVTADAVSEQGHAVVTVKLTVTAGLRGSWTIHDAPVRFQVSDFFGNPGQGHGIISRRC